MIRFSRTICGTLETASQYEWLEANGRGSYALGTVCGANTRRYHGLLIAATQPPVARKVLVNRLEESLIIRGQEFALASQQYPGTVHPHGHQFLEQFRLDPFPVWTYAISDVRVEKRFFLRYGEDTAVVLYRLLSGPTVTLRIRPFVSVRSHHQLIREDKRFQGTVVTTPTGFRIATAEGPTFLIQGNEESQAHGEGVWYRRLQYQEEQERGLDFTEDVYSPGVIVCELSKPSGSAGREGGGLKVGAAVVMTRREGLTLEVERWEQQEIGRRRSLVTQSKLSGVLGQRLALAADQFIVTRQAQAVTQRDGISVIAGYPWFEDWGRDTMIALPGLCLVTGRADEARLILKTFARVVDQGMLPNRFPDAGTPPEYNTADAALWFIWAVQQFLAYTGDRGFVTEILPLLEDIVVHHQRGTRYRIHADSDGLLWAGEPGTQLTWMDAKVGDRVITPRVGKPVELQALWYNALRFLEQLTSGRGGGRYGQWAAQAKGAFNDQFWNSSKDYLYDCLNGGTRDGSVRPNALFAISLPNEILDPKRFRPVVETAWQELYTSLGLRSLAPSDPQYRGCYTGDPQSRDHAYHQGTVWPFLMGAFITAYLKAFGRNQATAAQVQQWLTPFEDHLWEAGLGTVSEICEGDPPHAPRGCVAQAWSVGELLRVLYESTREVSPASKTAVAA
ncbi:MAG: glycogen debranching enzyme family protein [Elusimicrobia bacterium]|nr:glycogen debranching enzyme family protein [Elusimicrobiota bacterium]